MNAAGVAAWLHSSDARNIMTIMGSKIANDARQNAPRDTGAMAESIDYEVEDTLDGPIVRVSWDDDHFYGMFVELGTSEHSPRPFLRPAALKNRRI
jgi:HK97 gp10 family phage protein